MKEEFSYSPSLKRAVLLVATLANFLAPFVTSSINVALPSIQREFNLDAVLLSWLPASTLLASAVLLVPMGRLADIYGRKRIFTGGVITIAASSILCATATSGPVLIAWRFVQGIGGAMIFGTSVAMLSQVYPASERGRVIGIAYSAAYLSTSLGPVVGGVLTQYIGWRSIFLIMLPLCLVIIGYIFLRVKVEWAEARGESFDLGGSVLYGCAIGGLVWGLSSLPSASGFIGLAAGILSLLLFLRLETSIDRPVLNIDLFRKNVVFALSNLAALIHYSAGYASFFLLSLYLQYPKGLSARNAGFLLVAQPAVQTLFTPFAGRLSDRIEPRLVASAGMFITALGLFACSCLTETTPLPLVLAVLGLLGLGWAFFGPSNGNAVMSSVDKKIFGLASGILASARTVGMMLSMSTVMLIFGIYMGRVQIAPQNYPLLMKAIRSIFLLLACLSCAGVFASLAGMWPRSRAAR